MNPPTKTTRRAKQTRARQRVETVLDAARRLILRSGAAGFTMTELAREAGISASSIYQYFENRRAVVVHLAREHLELAHDALATVLAPLPDDLVDLEERLKSAIVVYYRHLRADPLATYLRRAFVDDRELARISADDDVKLQDTFFEGTQELFDPREHRQVRLSLRLLWEFVNTGIDLAASAEAGDGDAILQALLVNFDACWEASLAPHAKDAK